jgi:hypothetical protein
MSRSNFAPAILTDHGTIASRTLGRPSGTSYESAHTSPEPFRPFYFETQGDTSAWMSTTLG